jgi:hypothetical protein
MWHEKCKYYSGTILAILDPEGFFMATAAPIQPRYQPTSADRLDEVRYEAWKHWPIHWSAVWAGALAALAVGLIFGLIGIAVGANLLGPEHRVVDLTKLKLTTVALSIFGAFLSFAVGGWVAGKIAGILHSEPAMLHGAIVWLVGVPLLLILAALGAGGFFGGWYGGLAGTPAWGARAGMPYERPQPLAATATAEARSQYAADETEYEKNVKQWRDDTPKATRNSALCAVTALLLGLVGAVVGGWAASGEPMTFGYHRKRNLKM